MIVLPEVREREINALLPEKPEIAAQSADRSEIIAVETVAALQQELKESESLSSYQEMKEWLALIQGQKLSYVSI